MLKKDIPLQAGVFLQADIMHLSLYFSYNVRSWALFLSSKQKFSSSPRICELRNDKSRVVRSDLAKVGHCTSAQATMEDEVVKGGQLGEDNYWTK